MEGKTVLYVPSEGQKVDPEIASRDKELVQRLESKSIRSVYSDITSPLLYNNFDQKFIYTSLIKIHAIQFQSG